MTDSKADQTHHREQEVFFGALEIETPLEQTAYLDEQCAGDSHLRGRVEALLRANAAECILQSAWELQNWAETLKSDQSTIPLSSGRWVPPLPEELEKCLPGYTITSLLGRGGMGAVYRGTQISLDREVAIKLLPPELAANPQFATRFQREAMAMAKLNHPNIVQIYDFGKTTQNHYFFVMEFVNGCDLHTYVRSGKLSAADALAAVGQICSALQYAHDKCFVHRDIKPANIFLSSDGVLKVGDFGLAKLVRTDADIPDSLMPPDLTLTGYAMGTPNYMAPEQFEGKGNIDHRADLYSLGIMFYEMLTGELPRGAVKPPSEKIKNLDIRIDDVVFKAMESKLEYRYQTASDLHSDVDEIRNSTAIPVEVEKKESHPKQKSKSWKVWFWIISGLLELGAVFYFIGLPAINKPPAPPTVPGKLMAVGKMAKGINGGLVPVDLSNAYQGNDYIQITGKYRGGWVALREDGMVDTSNVLDFRSAAGIYRLGQRSGSSGHLYYVNQKGEIISSNSNFTSRNINPETNPPAKDVATHNGHGLILYRNGKATPFGKDYEDNTRFRPEAAKLTKISRIAVGENASAVLKSNGSVMAWGKEGELELPPAFSSNIVAIAVSKSPGIIALDKEGRIYAAHGGKIESMRRDSQMTVKQLVGGDNVYSPPLYQTSDGEWHLFEEASLKKAHPEIISVLPLLKGLPPEAFHIRLDDNPSSEAYLIYIDPAIHL